MADDTDTTLDTLLGIVKQAESGGRDYRQPGVPLQSPAGALYAMQVLPSTAASPGYGVRPAAAQTPAEYNRVGTDLFSALYNNFGGDKAKAFAAYHSGPGNVNNLVAQFGNNWQQHLGPQGRSYVTSNLAAFNQAQPAPVGGQPVANPTQPPAGGALATLVPQAAPAAPQAAPAAPLAIGALDPSNPNALLQNAVRLQQQYEGQAETGVGSKYDAAEAALRQQRQQTRGLSAADLFKLSAALASPTKTPGFGGMMANVMPVLGDITSTREGLINKYPQQLLALQQQRAADLLQARQEGLKNITPLAEKLATYSAEAAKAGQPVQNTVTGRWELRPKMNDKGQRIVNSQEQASMVPAGEPFVYEGDAAGTVYYGRRN